MRKNLKRIATLFVAAVVMVGGFTACGSGSTDGTETQNTNNAVTSQLKGTLTMAGSTSMEKLSNALAEGFMAANPGVIVTPEFNGSSAGVEQVIAGTVEIGNASRGLKEGERSDGAVENIVAIDGIVVVVDTTNTVTDISTEDLVKIYTGKINNWKELGGKNLPIVVIGREAGSGTRSAFEELLESKEQCAYVQELDSTGAVMANVATTPGAIGYISLDVLNDSVVPVSIDGVEATEENIASGSYSLSRPFVMATKGEISEQNELVQAFFAYIESEEGRAIIKQVGLIIPEHEVDSN